MRVIDQRELQRLGGRRAKYPSAAVVDMLLRPLRPGCVLETTYGEGRFYLVFRPPYLIGADVERREWLVRPDEFYEMPVWALYHGLRGGRVRLGRRPDVVVCDPPWGYWQRRLHYWGRSAWGSPRLILEYSAKVAELAGARFLLLHWGEEPPELAGDLEGLKPLSGAPLREGGPGGGGLEEGGPGRGGRAWAARGC